MTGARARGGLIFERETVFGIQTVFFMWRTFSRSLSEFGAIV